MSEKDVVLNTNIPITRKSLANDLKTLGLKNGDIIIAHVSMSKLGWVVGREVSVLDAILDVLGNKGTLIMPAQSGDNSDPYYWENPPVPSEWFDIIKENMPVYDPKRTPTRSMGKVVDNLLMHPDCIKSYHPQVSFCGIGKEANYILADHPLSYGFGIGSPLHKLYEMNAKILLLGVGYGNCTSLHLAETQIDNIITHKTGSKMLVDGIPTWVEYEEICYNDEDFELLGNDYEETHQVNKYKIGNYTCRLIDMKDLCDYAYTWFTNHR